MRTKPHAFMLSFVKKEEITKDVFAFYFAREKEDWDFYPGQYIQMILPNSHADERGTMRYFTIASSPTDKKYLRIVTKVIESSFKRDLFSLKKGEHVSFYGPSGDFYLQPGEDISHVFLAGGIGITPFLSMLSFATEKKLINDITLFATFSTFDDSIVSKKLLHIPSGQKNIKTVYSLTGQSHPLWIGEIGRISKELLQKHLREDISHIFYVVGSPSMVEATVLLLEEMGIAQDHIFQEHFSGY